MLLTRASRPLLRQPGLRDDWSALFAGLIIAMLPVLVVYLIFQRQVQAGLTGGHPEVNRPGR